jgi:hypothetical protein
MKPPKTEVELTPEMVEAGMRALAFSGYRSDFETVTTEEVVREVFRMMLLASGDRPGPSECD